MHEHHLILQGNGIIITLLLAGFFGGFTHCIGMCSPFVLGQVTSRMEHLSVDKMSELQRMRGAALIPYHLGRITTYVILSVIAVFVSSKIADIFALKWLSAALLFVAAVMFISSGIGNIKLYPKIRFCKTPPVIKTLFINPVGFRGYFLGLFLGFLPCGLVYTAVAASSATGDIFSAVIAMSAFSIGTVPALIITGFGGHFMLNRRRKLIITIGKTVMTLNGIVLFYIVGQLIFSGTV